MLTTSQTVALAKIDAFLARPGLATFSLQGGAGVGKTYLVAELIKKLLSAGRRVTVAAPTHKACRVLRGKLDAAGIRWAFKPKKIEAVGPGVAIVDTTAALLGIRPVISEDQTEDELAFKATGSGSLTNALQGRAPVLVIDEVSMVGRDDLLALVAGLRQIGAKLIAVGDEGQLPPVKKLAIDFERDFDSGALLDEVVRQAADSAIIQLAWAIRRDEPWEGITGKGIEQVEDVTEAFLSSLTRPVDDESRRSVFIAYRNALVNEVQERACRQLYGHGSRSFRQGELVLATMAGYREVYGDYVDRFGRRRPSRFPRFEQVVAVADQLRVLAFNEARRDPMLGVPVKLERVDLPLNAEGREFTTHYLSQEELANPEHPYNLRKAELAERARELQTEMKTLRDAGQHDQAEAVDEERKRAWADFFKHQQLIISFSHPFAITSHKSQGSTYHTAYVAAADLVRFNRKALYVAVTRPSQRLVM